MGWLRSAGRKRHGAPLRRQALGTFLTKSARAPDVPVQRWRDAGESDQLLLKSRQPAAKDREPSTQRRVTKAAHPRSGPDRVSKRAHGSRRGALPPAAPPLQQRVLRILWLCDRSCLIKTSWLNVGADTSRNGSLEAISCSTASVVDYVSEVRQSTI